LEAQSRNQNQSFYQVTLANAGSVAPQGFTWSGFAGAFRLGVHHIAEGTDHLLFLLTLLLPAPLLALGGRWKVRATIRQYEHSTACTTRSPTLLRAILP
jgi:HupE / UreJ protein